MGSSRAWYPAKQLCEDGAPPCSANRPCTSRPGCTWQQAGCGGRPCSALHLAASLGRPSQPAESPQTVHDLWMASLYTSCAHISHRGTAWPQSVFCSVTCSVQTPAWQCISHSQLPTLLRSLLLSKVTWPSSDSSRSLAALRAFLAMLPLVSAPIPSLKACGEGE